MDDNFFGIDESDSEVESRPEFIPKSADGYVVVARFRNQEDYFKFADLIGQPRLKTYSPTGIRKTEYPEVIDSECDLEFLMG